MTNLQAGRPSRQGHTTLPSAQHTPVGSPQKSTQNPNYAHCTIGNKMSWGGSLGPQQTRNPTMPVSNTERRYQLRRPLVSSELMDPPSSVLPASRAAQDWDREQLQHCRGGGQEKDDRMKFEEASRLHGLNYAKLQTTVEDAPDAPTSPAGEGSPDDGTLHQGEHGRIISPSDISSVETEIISPEIVQRYHRQVELFQSLERSCTAAAQTYWHSQCDSSFFQPLVLRRPRLRRNQRESEPYPTGRIRSLPQHSLASCLSDIARNVWERAEGPAEELEAVYRMGNIYSWGERVIRAARGELGIAPEEEIFKVVIAALDLTSWMLCEEAKAEIVRILARGEWALA